jgi:predicted Zn-dependent protease
VDLAADGQWAKALAELEPVVAAEPENYGALLAYGEALRHAGRAGEAVTVHRRAAVAYPQSLAVLYQLADDYAAAGEAQVAREVRDRALRDFPGLGLAVLRRRRGRALGERNFAEAARLHGAIEALLREAGDREGLAAEAPLGLGLAYERGVALLEEESIEEAEREFRQVLAQDPAFVPAAIMLGEALLVRDDAAGALAEWRRGWESTGSPVFLQRIEDHFIERAEPERAIETLRGVIAAAREGDVLPRFLLGRLYYRLEMHHEALRVLEPLADHMAAAPTYHFLLGRIHERRGEMRRSVESYHASCRELGVDAVDYACRFCGAKSADWSDRCAACGSWNAVELDFRAERAAPVAADRGAAVMGSYDGPDYT